MKIPLGDFGNSVAQAAPVVDTSAVFQTARDVFNSIQRTGEQVDAQQREQRQQLQRAKAHNAALDYQLEVETATQETAAGIESGEIDYNHAGPELEKRVTAIKRPEVELEDPVDVENFNYVLHDSAARASRSLVPVVHQARARDGVAQVDQSFDTLGKLAGLPDANIDDINKQAAAVAANARTFGIPKDILERKLQDFQDRTWTNQATQRQIENTNSMAGLKALEHDLTAADGLYAKKLDVDKRNAILRGVQSDIDRINARAEAKAARLDARAFRAINEIDRQIASGVPATGEKWVEWSKLVKGTEYEADFRDRVEDEKEVQAVLRQPIAAQLKYVQDREAQLDTEGGTVREVANQQRLAAVVSKNVKLMQTAPLQYIANRFGEKADPIDIAKMGTPGGDIAIADQLRQRTVAIEGLRKQAGLPVPLRPLLPQEARQLSGLMESVTPTQATQLFEALRTSTGSSDIFRAVMAQVAPDQPVKALAGVLSTMQRDLTTASHWFKPDESITSRDVAATMLEGDRILNRSSTAKGEDGKPQNRLVLPDTKVLQELFEEQVGNNFRGDPQGKERAFQAAQAFYVGRVAQTGMRAKDGSSADKQLMKLAVRSTLGEIVDYNGNGQVQAPWGMAEGDFEDRVERTIRSQAKAAGIPDEQVQGNIGALGLDNGPGDGVYVLTRGGTWLYDNQGNPVLIDIRPPDARDARGTISRSRK